MLSGAFDVLSEQAQDRRTLHVVFANFHAGTDCTGCNALPMVAR